MWENTYPCIDGVGQVQRYCTCSFTEIATFRFYPLVFQRRLDILAGTHASPSDVERCGYVFVYTSPLVSDTREWSQINKNHISSILLSSSRSMTTLASPYFLCLGFQVFLQTFHQCHPSHSAWKYRRLCNTGQEGWLLQSFVDTCHYSVKK